MFVDVPNIDGILFALFIEHNSWAFLGHLHLKFKLGYTDFVNKVSGALNG